MPFVKIQRYCPLPPRSRTHILIHQLAGSAVVAQKNAVMLLEYPVSRVDIVPFVDPLVTILGALPEDTELFQVFDEVQPDGRPKARSPRYVIVEMGSPYLLSPIELPDPGMSALYGCATHRLIREGRRDIDLRSDTGPDYGDQLLLVSKDWTTFSALSLEGKSRPL